MTHKTREPKIIGRAEEIAFPELHLEAVPARIDTGARTAALWASDITVEDGVLSFCLFGKESPLFTGERISLAQFSELVVASSNGMMEKRYLVKLLVKIGGRKIRASFTLANRSTQVYPVLIGRNVLLGKFIVDVKKGRTQHQAEQARIAALQSQLKEL